MFSPVIFQVPLVGTLYNIYFFMIIAYVLLSWIPNARGSYVGQLLARAVEPYVGFFRRFIPPIGGMIDISPIVAIFLLRFIFMGLDAVLAAVLSL